MLKWRIPCFPVMEIEFQPAWATIKGQHCKILVPKDQLSFRCPVNILCTSHCQITVNGVGYLVVWKWEKIRIPTNVVTNDVSPHSPEADQNPDVTHTLPFKVMGVTYCKHAQDHLERAQEQLHTKKENVHAKVFAEPENPHDSKAIAVAIKYAEDWVKIGYIPAELTQYLHSVWDSGQEVNATVKHIKFRTSYWKIGHYITVNLTKRGQWEKAVMKAAKRVQ